MKNSNKQYIENSNKIQCTRENTGKSGKSGRQKEKINNGIMHGTIAAYFTVTI